MAVSCARDPRGNEAFSAGHRYGRRPLSKYALYKPWAPVFEQIMRQEDVHLQSHQEDIDKNATKVGIVVYYLRRCNHGPWL